MHNLVEEQTRYSICTADKRLALEPICSFKEGAVSFSFEDAVKKAETAAKRFNDIGKEIFIMGENVRDKDGYPIIMWSSADDPYLKRYLSVAPEVWSMAKSFDHEERKAPSVYIDIDGTLGRWYSDSRGYANLEEILDPANHYFRDIEPHPFMIEVAKQLHDDGFDVCILSAADKGTIRDKWDWISQHLPFIEKSNIFFTPLGADKSEFVKKNAEISVLIDDYNVNLDAWKGYPVKAINTVNSHQYVLPEIDIKSAESVMHTDKYMTALEYAVSQVEDMIRRIETSL